MTPHETFKSADIDKAAALADSSVLHDFDDREVVRADIAITNAGDGLSSAMAVQPRELKHGEEVTIVLRGTVTKVGFRPVDPQDPEGSALVRVHTIKAGASTILNETNAKKVQGAINKQQADIKRAVEAARGIDPLRTDRDDATGQDDVDLDGAGLDLGNDEPAGLDDGLD